ncbi:MAG: carboxypeptidase-like regulatory domain-containing protein [Alphaproteobacteria bacterium]
MILLWNAYIAGNNDGILKGQVIGPDDAPAAGAEVQLSEQTIVSLNKIDATTADDQGYFKFLRHDQHSVVLTAAKDGFGKSGRYRVRLLFRNQNHVMHEPIRLNP